MKCECRNYSNDTKGHTFYVVHHGQLVSGWIGDICPDCNTPLVKGWHR